MKRWGLRALLAAGVLAVLVLLGAAWLLTSPGGARLVLDRVAGALGQGTTVTGVEGSLAGVLRVKSIEVRRPDLYILVRDLVIERAPEGWWSGRAEFRRVEAALVEVRTASSGAAARVPLAFEAPYPLRVEAARVGELRVGALARQGVQPPPVVLKELVLAGEGDERAWKLEKGSALTPWGEAHASGTLATKRPFALDLRADLSGARDDLRYRIAAVLGGTLQKVEAKLEAAERDLRIDGTAILEPFEKQPLRSLQARARSVDLSRYARLPATRLDIDATLSPTGSGFAGPVRIVNAQPGPLDRQRVPVTSAEARVAWMRDGTPELRVSEARLALAGGGSIEGNAAWKAGRLEAKVALANVDPSQWHSRLRATRVAGTVNAVSEGSAQRFEVALSDPRFAIEGLATLANARLDIASARVKHQDGVVEGKGYLALAQKRDFRFEGRARHFNPGAFVTDLAGDLNFDFVASGALEPALSGDVRFDIAESRLAGLPTSGNVRIAGDARRIANADVRLAIGDTRLQANGAFGRPGDTLQLAVQSPNLGGAAKTLGLEIAGKLDARATLTGTFASPGGRFELTAANLSMPGGLYAAALSARGEVSGDAGGKVDVTAEARTLTRRTGDAVQTLAERAAFTIQGTRASHRASLVAGLAKDSELRAVLQGGLDARAPRPAWRGELVSLSLTGPSAFSLAASAPLALAADRVELGDARVKGAWGEAHLALTRWSPALIELRGDTSGIGVRSLARALRLQAVPRGNLAVAAEWDIKAAETVDGFVSVSRVSGDLRIGDPPQALGLEELKLRVEAQRGQARATVSLRGQPLGRLDGEARGTLRHVRAGLGLVPDAPIEGRIDAQMDSLAWAAAWMGPEARADGRARARVNFSGTIADPRWSGRVEAEGVSLREPQTGFEVEKGVVALALTDRSLVVEKLTASTPWHPPQAALKVMEGLTRPAEGTLSASGSVDLGTRTGAIAIKAVSVPVTQLATRFLALSGEAKLEARSDGLLATGAFRADAGWIGALATALPSVSDDVVVVRKSAPVDERRRERLRMDVRFNLGDHMAFSGRGLDTRLQGELRIVGEPGTGLRGTGAIRTASGTYDAYGRKLTIEYGSLTFFGSLENPSLDVRALRKGLPVEAGVEVRGNVARPRVRLVSAPDVPEPEKISWLVLGRGPSDVSQSEAATLVAAANAILGRNTGGQLTERLGFDEVRVGRSDSGSALGVMPESTVAGRTGSGSASDVVTVGKRLNKDLYLAYERGLADAEDTLRLTWQITRQFQMLLRAGYLPGVDAVYRWTFE